MYRWAYSLVKTPAAPHPLCEGGGPGRQTPAVDTRLGIDYFATALSSFLLSPSMSHGLHLVSQCPARSRVWACSGYIFSSLSAAFFSVLMLLPTYLKCVIYSVTMELISLVGKARNTDVLGRDRNDRKNAKTPNNTTCVRGCFL